MKYNKDSRFHQQGDVLIISVTDLPTKVMKRSFMNNRFVLAEGEVTGHCHALLEPKVGIGEKLDDKIEIFQTDDGTIFLKNTAPVEIEHEEHGTATIEPGIWEIGNVKEYDHFLEESRRVSD